MLSRPVPHFLNHNYLYLICTIFQQFSKPGSTHTLFERHFLLTVSLQHRKFYFDANLRTLKKFAETEKKTIDDKRKKLSKTFFIMIKLMYFVLVRSCNQSFLEIFILNFSWPCAVISDCRFKQTEDYCFKFYCFKF